ncbi:MAG TPA: MBL fold metallo-hydrolase [Gemmatimonadota bacterium]|nr:MBL fold metallo-hydrolase [Gemmatimonadota bacterium]
MSAAPARGGRLVVVGCGTVVPEGGTGGSSYYVEVDGGRVLLDCGPGAAQSLARHGLPWSELTDLVVTHFHSDHVGALPGLFFGLRHGVRPPRETALDVWGPPGTRRLFETLAEALGDFLLDPGFPVEIHEIGPGRSAELRSGLRLSACATPHTDESQAVRLDGTSAAVGYTGDTGVEPRLGEFLSGLDVLVAECSLTDEEVGDNHLSPSRVAALARDARPELLLLTHIYPHVRERHDVGALVAAAGWSGPTRPAREGLSVPLPVDPGDLTPG